MYALISGFYYFNDLFTLVFHQTIATVPIKQL